MGKNLMQKLAEMLGVEVGEEFTIYDTEIDIHGRTVFLITDKGLICKEEPKRDNDYVLKRLLLGTMEIEKIPWKPKYGEYYYCPSVNQKKVIQPMWLNDTRDYSLKVLGMIYRTKEKAEKHYAEDFKKLTGKEFEG